MKIIDGSLEKTALTKERDDLSLAEEAARNADVAQLHTLLRRVIEERTQLAKGFEAVVRGWSLMGGEKSDASPEAMFAIERVAHEAIAFAREVVQALTKRVE